MKILPLVAAFGLIVGSLIAVPTASAAQCLTGEIGLASQTLASVGTTITFASIPQTSAGSGCTWNNLRITAHERTTATASCEPWLIFQLNGDTSGDYNYQNIYDGGHGYGSAGGTGRTYAQTMTTTCDTDSAGHASSLDLRILDYTNTTFDKQFTISGSEGTTNIYTNLTSWTGAGTWRNHTGNGVNQIDMALATTASFKTGSVFVIYVD